MYLCCLSLYIISGIIPIPEFEVCFVACADHLVNEFDQIKSISAFKDVHSNTGIFGIHTSTVSIKFTSLLVMHNVVIFMSSYVPFGRKWSLNLLQYICYPFLCENSNHAYSIT